MYNQHAFFGDHLSYSLYIFSYPPVKTNDRISNILHNFLDSPLEGMQWFRK